MPPHGIPADAQPTAHGVYATDNPDKLRGDYQILDGETDMTGYARAQVPELIVDPNEPDRVVIRRPAPARSVDERGRRQRAFDAVRSRGALGSVQKADQPGAVRLTAAPARPTPPMPAAPLGRPAASEILPVPPAVAAAPRPVVTAAAPAATAVRPPTCRVLFHLAEGQDPLEQAYHDARVQDGQLVLEFDTQAEALGLKAWFPRGRVVVELPALGWIAAAEVMTRLRVGGRDVCVLLVLTADDTTAANFAQASDLGRPAAPEPAHGEASRDPSGADAAGVLDFGLDGAAFAGEDVFGDDGTPGVSAN
jgi:hypothetical protein